MQNGFRGGQLNQQQNPYSGMNGSKYPSLGMNRFNGMNNSMPNFPNQARNNSFGGAQNYGQNANQDPFRTQSPGRTQQPFSENENGMNSYGLVNPQNRQAGFNLKGANPNFQNNIDGMGRRGSTSPQGTGFNNMGN